jgi:hypothetical protein
MDAVILGDSWVYGSDTWAFKLAKKQGWYNVSNLARSGATINDCREGQLSEVDKVDASTLFIIHCGGNDLLRFVRRNPEKHILDCLILQLGGQPLFYTAAGLQVSEGIVNLLTDLVTQHGARNFLVSSSTMSSSMPLCKYVMLATSPLGYSGTIDMVTEIVNNQLIDALLRFQSQYNNISITYHDEGLICKCKKHELTDKWEYDGFHLCTSGHDILSEEAFLALEESKPLKQFKRHTSVRVSGANAPFTILSLVLVMALKSVYVLFAKIKRMLFQ